MNTKSTPHNSFKVTLLTAGLTVSALAFAHLADFGSDQVAPVQHIQSEYGIVSLQMLYDAHGEAVVNLDGFRLEITSFEVEAHLDDHRGPGSEFANLEVVD